MTEGSANTESTHAEETAEQAVSIPAGDDAATSVQQTKKKQKRPGKKPFISKESHVAFITEKSLELAAMEGERKDKKIVEWKASTVEQFVTAYKEDFKGENLEKVRKVSRYEQ